MKQRLHLHFDPSSGIAGDMTVAALVDAGVPRAVVTGAIKAMGVPGLRTKFEQRRRGAFVGTGFVVTWPGMDHGHDHDHDHHHEHGGHAGHAHHLDHDHEHRDFAEIRRLLKRAKLKPGVRALAEEIFHKVAEAEGALHGVPAARVRFHEVGAYDSIADVVGAAAAIVWLSPSAITSTAPVVGTGNAKTAHGLISVPAPATAALLRGIPVRAEGQGELTTPTGAAILATVVDQFVPLPPMRLVNQGFGAGTRELSDRANVLRVFLGEPIGHALPAPPSDVLLIETNIDDMNPQLVEPLMTALLRAGAVDVWATPILMKKGRPALQISALTGVSNKNAVEQAFFANSTTIGLRARAVERTVLGRSLTQVKTRYGSVSVKVAAVDGQVRGATPEFDDCARLAAKAGVPVRQVLAAAQAAADKLRPPWRTKAG